ncbi:PTS sugar transporter subunit IIA [Campylobacter sp. US33a]|uniref:PTS sugar transporter subunit IIA n=1 Tax=Campylobacter sp. US33a TaxID=2498120 RepID=UPI001067950A|nr:PTS sugar transporter subunit IIA [Campylobacter sp. US33a]MCW1360364.1 PTS sugar transporter subunit IIA [Campylobacter jejuni]TEY04459.1 hypothetical protein ELQ16_00060 [Campylobacter sp. US33a]
MSKPLQEEIFKEQSLIQESKFAEPLMQILSLLEILKSSTNEKMARISSELSEILSDESKFEKIQNAKNLEELLQIIEKFNFSQMLKIYDLNSLRMNFPLLAKQNFLA